MTDETGTGTPGAPGEGEPPRIRPVPDPAPGQTAQSETVSPPLNPPDSVPVGASSAPPPATQQTASVPIDAQPAESPAHKKAAQREPATHLDRREFDLQLEEASLLMQLAANKLRQLEGDAQVYADIEQREEIARDIDILTRRTLSVRSRCTYCRRDMTTPMGACATCGRDVCAECGQAIGDVVVHRGNCAMFYEQKKEQP